ncbi:hypothetical protein NKR19_g9721 [Coniochaeta hoffmannii]|uniref:Uncharacterized protein n=1 Tax=Coniochaeta hoffmannii TaxID=91930 RepID=A0AA38VD60_9PEZI|nr:hypothetical protein NKR19_g9721 [Coniochaeta hoffmannii]
MYATYADRAAHSIAGGIIDAQSLRAGTAPAASITTSLSSGPKSSAASKGFTETTTDEHTVKRLKKRKAAHEVQRPGPLTHQGSTLEL